MTTRSGHDLRRFGDRRGQRPHRQQGDDRPAGAGNSPARKLISGNSQDGVLIQNGSENNVLNGNFVGTAANGTRRGRQWRRRRTLPQRRQQLLDWLQLLHRAFRLLQRGERQRRQRPAHHEFRQRYRAGQLLRHRCGQRDHGRQRLRTASWSTAIRATRRSAA